MGIATKIPQNTFEGLQVDAGVLLTTFDPTDPEITDAAIICATTGGITVSCVPTYSDYGEDVDNCPNNMKELKRLDSWECKISTTSLGTSLESMLSVRQTLHRHPIRCSHAVILHRQTSRQSGGLVTGLMVVLWL